MKKIYLDWNIINHLEEDHDLFEFILQNQLHFVFVYSPAHFSDLMKSYKENGGNTYFEKDLNRLETICETHLMYYSDKKMSVCKCPPTEFLEKEGKYYPTIKDVFNPDYFKNLMNHDGVEMYNHFCNSLKSISFENTIEMPLMDSFSNGLEYLNCTLAFFDKILSDKKFVNDFRTTITNNLTNKDIKKINSYQPDKIIEIVNAYLYEHGSEGGSHEIIRKALQDNNQYDEKLMFESLYIGLDFMRFHPDKRDLMNILTDADHAYYGSYCDVLVTSDAKMKSKAEAVYSHLNKKTKIISKQELLQYLKDEINGEMMIEEPLKEVMTNQNIPKEYSEDDVYVKYTTLEHPFWCYFDRLEYQLNLSSRQFCFVFTNQMKFTFYSETDKFLEILKKTFNEQQIYKKIETEYIAKVRLNDKTAVYSFSVDSKLRVTLATKEEGDHLTPMLYMYYDIFSDA